MPTVAYHTLGCKVNQYDTQAMEELLSSAGFTTGVFSILPVKQCLTIDVKHSIIENRMSMRAAP